MSDLCPAESADCDEYPNLVGVEIAFTHLLMKLSIKTLRDLRVTTTHQTPQAPQPYITKTHTSWVCMRRLILIKIIHGTVPLGQDTWLPKHS